MIADASRGDAGSGVGSGTGSGGGTGSGPGPACGDRAPIRAFLSRLRRACRDNAVQVDPDTQQDAENIGFEATEIESVLLALDIDDHDRDRDED